jgi:hypothetical protein
LKVLDQKLFHPYDTEVKQVIASCILHHWILGCGLEELVPEEVVHDEVESGHGVELNNNEAWKNKSMEWANTMWAKKVAPRRRRRLISPFDEPPHFFTGP